MNYLALNSTNRGKHLQFRSAGPLTVSNSL